MAELGLVSRVVPEGTALEAALELAGRIARNAPLAVRASTEVLRSARDWSDEETFRRLEPVASRIRGSDDAREGMRAFAEKRPPVWRGR
jgi:enoyl-CoA hydratase